MASKCRILIVDDDDSLARTMGLVLQRSGHAVTTALSGKEAVDRVENTPFDVVFLDIKMPVMNGVETLKTIKKVRPEAMVIMMTAYAVEDLVQEALAEGAYAIVYKPLDIDKTLALINKARRTKKGALVLVVDDDSGTCIALKNVLTRKGYEVATVSTGEQAIAVARERAHDIVFLDVRLPTINGLETYLAIKKVNPQAVAIMITGYREEVAELVDLALNHNAYTCLYKPLDLEAVLTLLDGIEQGVRR